MRSRRGQVIVEMVFAALILSALLSAYLSLIKIVEVRLRMLEALRCASFLLSKMPDQQSWIERTVATLATEKNLQLQIRRYDGLASARFYNLNELSISVQELPFSLTTQDRVVISPPQED